jgi:hypothetical protein
MPLAEIIPQYRALRISGNGLRVRNSGRRELLVVVWLELVYECGEKNARAGYPQSVSFVSPCEPLKVRI